jgi:hypothetical protein
MQTDDIKQIADEFSATRHQLSVALEKFAATNSATWTEAQHDLFERAQQQLERMNELMYGKQGHD